MNPVKLTVALPTFNRVNTFLPEAINAILAQTYRDFELLVLDNGSTDSTASFVLGLNDPRIRYVRNAIGTTVEFNFLSAFHIALGHRIVVTHDDDIMDPDMLEKQMRFMDENPEVKLVWTSVRYIDEHGKPIGTQVPGSGGHRLFGPGEYILNFPLERLWPMPSTVMMVRSAIRRQDIEISYYRTRKVRRRVSDAQVAGLADVTFPAFINTKAAIGFIDEPLLRYRIHGSQYTFKTNISVPGVYLYRRLKSFARRAYKSSASDSLFDSHMARFAIQDKVCTTRRNLGAAKLRLIQSRVEKVALTPLSVDAVYPLLPVHILLKMAGLTSPLDDMLTKLPVPDRHTNAARCLYLWASAEADGRGILSSLEKRTRIVILGTAFVSALLILEAKKYGYTVVACIDSNITRQGDTLLNVPIHAPNWLTAHKDDIDLVLFSSEKDHEQNLRKVISRHAGDTLATLSWKQLVQEGVEAQLVA